MASQLQEEEATNQLLVGKLAVDLADNSHNNYYHQLQDIVPEINSKFAKFNPKTKMLFKILDSKNNASLYPKLSSPQ